MLLGLVLKVTRHSNRWCVFLCATETVAVIISRIKHIHLNFQMSLCLGVNNTQPASCLCCCCCGQWKTLQSLQPERQIQPSLETWSSSVCFRLCCLSICRNAITNALEYPRNFHNNLADLWQICWQSGSSACKAVDDWLISLRIWVPMYANCMSLWAASLIVLVRCLSDIMGYKKGHALCFVLCRLHFGNSFSLTDLLCFDS